MASTFGPRLWRRSTASVPAARSLGRRGIQTDAAHIQGSATFVEVTQEGGQPVQRIIAQFTVTDLKPPLPPAGLVINADATVTYLKGYTPRPFEYAVRDIAEWRSLVDAYRAIRHGMLRTLGQMMAAGIITALLTYFYFKR